MAEIETSSEYASGSQSPSTERLFCWTICAYRKEGMSEEAYHSYMSNRHAPLVKDLMVKYGIVSWEMTHNTSETRQLMKHIAGPQFNGGADYDCFVQATFRKIEDFVAMKADPYFKEHVAPDHENFADTKRSQMTVGWIEYHILDGKLV